METRLGDICEIITGSTPSSFNQEYYDGNFLRACPADLDQGNIVYRTKKTLTSKGVTEGKIRKIPKGAVMVCCIGTIGKCAIAGQEMATNQQINSFVPKDGGALDSKYLLFCIRAREKLFQGRSTSTTVPIINKTQCSNLEIPLPSLLEQQVIAARLDEIQELINLRRESLAKLEEYSKSLFLDMFGDPILNPKEWEVKTFRDISKLNQGLQIPISERSIHKINGSYPYITIQYLNGNKDSEFILAPSPSVICNKDDILMTRTGNTGQIIYGIEGVFHNNFFKIDYSRLVLDKMFIVFYLKFEHIQKIILAKAGTSTIPDLNHGDFYKIPIPIPPLTLQQEFESRIERINALKSDYQLSLDKLTELYQATMQHYFG